jgi:LmbE family N-acetylglucosaminyl deacetylase
MTTVASPSDIKSLGTILGIWAHPDDESFTCAGIMSTAVKNGQKVVCITATKGEQGIQDESRWPASKLGEIRAQELAEALKIIGIQNHHWLNYPDGSCADISIDEAASKIAEYINRYQPDTILTFGPEGLTGHPDHSAVSQWASLAVKKAGSKARIYRAVETRANYKAMKEVDQHHNIFFNIDEPPIREENECDILFRLNDELLLQKYQCLCAMPSQTDAMFSQFGEEIICQMVCTEAFVRAN